MITHNKILMTCHQNEGNASKSGIHYHVPYQHIFHHSCLLHLQPARYDAPSFLKCIVLSQSMAGCCVLSQLKIRENCYRINGDKKKNLLLHKTKSSRKKNFCVGKSRNTTEKNKNKNASTNRNIAKTMKNEKLIICKKIFALNQNKNEIGRERKKKKKKFKENMYSTSRKQSHTRANDNFLEHTFKEKS